MCHVKLVYYSRQSNILTLMEYHTSPTLDVANLMNTTQQVTYL